MNSTNRLPLYAKYAYISLGVVSTIGFLYVSGKILIPLVFATLLAIILDMFVSKLVQFNLNRVVSITIAVLLAISLLVVVSSFIISQASNFAASFPKLIDKFQELVNSLTSKMSQHLNVNSEDIGKWITQTKDDMLKNSGSLIGQTIGTLGGILVVVLLTPVYMFMILYYKPLILEFIHKLFQKNNPETVDEIFAESKAMIQHYLIGLLLQFSIVATLYSTGLLILGVQYAILLGVIGAVLNVVPYIGPWIAATLFMIMATVTDSSSFSHVLLVLLMFVVVHFADNTFIVPKIVASKVKLNALATLVAVFTGHAIWGVPGMFLSIPIVAIVKLLVDRIEPLKPWGILLGDAMPNGKNWNIGRKKTTRHK